MKVLVRGLIYFSVFYIHICLIYAQSSTAASFLLEDYLYFLQKKHHLTFSFDNDLIKGIRVAGDTTGLEEAQALSMLNEQTAFLFEKVNASVILVKPRAPGANLKLCGSFIDEETGESIPAVYLFDDRKTIGLMADGDGKFSALGNLSETGSIHIRMLGYEEKEVPASFFNGTGCPVISLKSLPIDTDPVVIQAYMGAGINYQFKDNSIQLRPSGLGLLPGETDADILSAIDALPGINTPDSKAGNLNVRGSTPDQTLFVFDNIPIYHKGHYFGTLSPYNPAVVDNINVQRGAYTADKGGRVGGAIEINSKNNIPDSTISGIAISTTYASAYTHIPVIRNKVGILLAGRTSYPSSWISPKLKAINDFIYQQSDVRAAESGSGSSHLDRRAYNFNDVNAKLMIVPGKKDQLNISFLHISNNVDIGISNAVRNSDNDNTMNLSNIGYNTEWNRKWNSRISTRIIGTQSYYAQSYTSRFVIRPDSLVQDAMFRNSLNDINLKGIATFSLSDNAVFGLGYDMRYQQQKYLDNTYNSFGPSSYVSTSPSSYLHSFFTTYTYTNPEKYVVNAGLRSNYYTLANDFRMEPRISATWFVNDFFSLKSSAGVFNQYVMQIAGVAIINVGGIENLLWLLADGRKIPVQRSNQVMVGGIWKRKGWILDMELYYKKINNLTIRNLFHPNLENRYIYGEEQTAGADVLLKKQWKRLDAWISYTLAQSQFDFDSLGTEAIPYIFDQTHILDLVVSYKWKQFRFSAGWKYRSGLPSLIGIRPRYLHGTGSTNPGSPNNSANNNVPQPGPGAPQGPGGPGSPPLPGPSGSSGMLPNGEYTDRFPAYHQLDISIVYALPQRDRRWNATVGLSLVNLYNRKNIIEQVPVPARNGGGLLINNKYAIGFSPNLVMSVNW